MSIIIGIDPDTRKSGVCMIDSMGQIVTLESMNINQLIALVNANKTAVYAIEDVTKNKAVYPRNIKSTSPIARENIMKNIAQKVGMCKASAMIIEDVIQGITTKRPILAPCGLGKQVKNNAALFKQLTGYQRQTNEDKRDAWAIANWVFKNKERLV